MSTLLIATPIAKKLPIKTPGPVRAIARRVELYAVAPAVAVIASRGGTLGQSSFACNQMSRAMSGLLSRLEVPHDVLYSTFPQSQWVMSNGKILTNSGAHFSIGVHGRVFDTVTGPGGKSFSAWADFIGARGKGHVDVRQGGSPGAFFMPNPLK